MNASIGDPGPVPSRLIDRYGRRVTYLRLAITDRCNLRCRYCMPDCGVTVLKHDKILSYEELERVSRIFTAMGVKKIRITGGEPFVRKSCVEFMERLKLDNPGLDLRLTTNGVAALQYLARLKKIGIGSINLSLDTMDPLKFKEITRRDALDNVLAVFHEALRLKIPLKVNSVVMEETTDEDMVGMAELIRENPISLRFIEIMPFSGIKHVERTMEMRLETRLAQLFPGITEISANDIETARKFSVPGYRGTLGIIEGESRKFCATCNKVRITPAGMLKNCLYDRGVLDLRALLRSGVEDKEVALKISAAVSGKLEDGYAAAGDQPADCEDSMATIGG